MLALRAPLAACQTRRRTLRPHGRLLVPALFAGVLAFSPSPAGAQSTGGPWWDLGLGAGWVHFTCDTCAPERDVGPVARIAMGGVATRNLLVGVEATGWTHRDDEEDVRETLFTVAGIAIARQSEGSFSLQGGIGWLGWRAEDFAYDGAADQVGLSYAFPLGGTFRVENALRLTAASFGSLKNQDDTAEEDVSVTFLTLAISLTSR